MHCALPLLLAAVLTVDAPGTVAPTLDNLIERALARSPEIEAQAARARGAEALVSGGGARQNPMLEVMLQNAGFPGWTVGEEEMSMIGPRIVQPMPAPGLTDARREVARADAGRLTHETEVIRRRIVRQVRVVYASIYALDRERQSLESAGELLELLGATVRQRMATGLGGPSALVEIQLRESRLAERAADLAAERGLMVASLERLLDGGLETPFGEVAALPEPPSLPEGWTTTAPARAPDLAARRAAVEMAASELELSEVEGRPDWSATAGVGFRGALDPVVTLGVGVGLPLWNGQSQKPRVRAAHEAHLAAQAELRTGEALLREEIAGIGVAWERAANQLARYDAEILPRTRLAFDTARASYLAGEGDFAPLVNALSEWVDARAGRARREADRFAAWASYEALVAAPPTAGVTSQPEGGH